MTSELAGTPREKGSKVRTLSHREELGSVALAHLNSILLSVKGQAVRLSEGEYRQLMEMLSEASVRMMDLNRDRREVAGVPA